MKIWLTTDTHFNHKKLIEYGRPKNFEEKIWNGLKNVDGGMLIHLGDFCIGNDTEETAHFMEIITCKKILVLGNHDHKTINWYLEHGWDLVCTRFDIELFGKRIAFTHAPIAWDGYFDVNIHGHFHDTDHRRYEPKFNGILSSYNKLLALEHTNYNPVSLESFISK